MSSDRYQTLVILRHGVARHNFHGANLMSPLLFDPPLIPEGKVKVVETGERIKTWWHTTQAGETIDVVITSPLTRCIQTSIIAFLPGDSYDKHVTFYCAEDCREAYGIHYPDKRREKSLLQVSGSYGAFVGWDICF
jgi:bisphosphoglycerate-dependent phosphoglycerate mutase